MPTTKEKETSLGGDGPEYLSITISVKKESDEISVSKCLDPQFDMEVLTEGLASLIMVNSKYTERNPLKVLEAVYKQLENAVKFHGTIRRSE